MFLLTFVNIYVAAVARAALLAFVSILYFKMYDFFYNFPQNRKDKTHDEQLKKQKHEDHEKSISTEAKDEIMLESQDFIDEENSAKPEVALSDNIVEEAVTHQAGSKAKKDTAKKKSLKNNKS